MRYTKKDLKNLARINTNSSLSLIESQILSNERRLEDVTKEERFLKDRFQNVLTASINSKSMSDLIHNFFIEAEKLAKSNLEDSIYNLKAFKNFIK